MKIIYVPVSNRMRVMDITSPAYHAFSTAEKAKAYMSQYDEPGQIAVMASREIEGNLGIKEDRFFLGLVGQMWILGKPEEDGEWLLKLKTGEVFAFEIRDGALRDAFNGVMEIDAEVVGYRPLNPCS